MNEAWMIELGKEPPEKHNGCFAAKRILDSLEFPLWAIVVGIQMGPSQASLWVESGYNRGFTTTFLLPE